MASNMNKSKRQLFPKASLLTRRLTCPAGDELQRDIQSWLSPPDPWKNYNIAHGLRHSGTGEWFIQGDSLSEWKASGPSSLLWIHGKRKWLLGAYSFAGAKGFPLRSGRREECTLVYCPFDIFFLRTHGIYLVPQSSKRSR